MCFEVAKVVYPTALFTRILYSHPELLRMVFDRYLRNKDKRPPSLCRIDCISGFVKEFSFKCGIGPKMPSYPRSNQRYFKKVSFQRTSLLLTLINFLILKI